jgi:hypothetical protein
MNYWLGAGLIAGIAALGQVICAVRVNQLAILGGSLRALRRYLAAIQVMVLLPCLGPCLMAFGFLSDPRFTPVSDGMVAGLLLSAWPSFVYFVVLFVASPFGLRFAPPTDHLPPGSMPNSHVRWFILHVSLMQTGLGLIVVGTVTPGPTIFLGLLLTYAPLLRRWLQQKQVMARSPLQPTGIEATPLHWDLVRVMQRLGWKGDSLPVAHWPVGTREERDLPGFAHSVVGNWVNDFNGRKPIFYSEVIRQIPAEGLTAITAYLMVSSVNGIRPAWQGWKVRLIALVSTFFGLIGGIVLSFFLSEALSPWVGVIPGIAVGLIGPFAFLGVTLLIVYRVTAMLGIHAIGAARYHDSFEAWREAGCDRTASEFVRGIFCFNLAANPHAGAMEAIRSLLLGHRPLTDFMLQAGLEPEAWYAAHREALAQELASMLPETQPIQLQDHLTASAGTGIDC